MSGLEKPQNDRVFLKVVGGTLRQTVPDGTAGAIRREWEAGGNSGVTHELEYNAIFGRITGIEFYEGEHDGRKFTNLQITLDENEELGKKPVVSVGVSSRYAEDIMKKLPNIDLSEDVRIRPFSFMPEGEDKNVTGVEITQRDSQDKFTRKIENFFYDKEKKTAKNGFPTPEGDVAEYTTNEWKIHFLKVNQFLIRYTQENIIPQFQVQAAATIPKSLEEQEEIFGSDPSKIPF